MNNSNIVIVISTLIIAAIFLGGVFVNLDIKSSKDELYQYRSDIEQLKLEIRRQKIEIATLTNPIYVLDFIEKNDFRPVPVSKIDILYIKNN